MAWLGEFCGSFSRHRHVELGFRTKIFQEMRLQTKQGPYSGCTFLTEAKQYEAVKQGLKEFNGSVVKVYNDMTPQKKD